MNVCLKYFVVLYFTWISYIAGRISLNMDLDVIAKGQRNSVWGRRLENMLIRTGYGFPFLECVYKCLIRTRCSSINYHVKNLQCELNKGDEKESLENYKLNSNFIYSNMDFWNKTLLFSPCDQKICPEKYKCKYSTGECVISDCGEPPSVDNAIAHGNGIALGRNQFYHCVENYQLVGDNRITCNSNGNWSTVQASCQRIGCGSPPEISNSTYNISATVDDEIYEYTCDVGYEVKGVYHPVVCQKNGTWSEILFKCTAKDCGDPRTFVHATSSGTGTSFGHSQVFTCNTGYAMSGDNSISCMENGRWSNILFTCTTIDCRTLYDAGVRTNGIYEISPNNMDRFNVSCDMSDGGWVVINRRVNGQVDFDRGWTDYVHGFGDFNADMWLGLKFIHILTSVHNYISFSFLMTSSGIHATVTHNDFRVLDENDKFRMYVSEIQYPNAEMEKYIGIYKGFYYHNGMQFSTKDSDNDLFANFNCADYNGAFNSSGGNWYRECLQLGNINDVFTNLKIYDVMTPYRFSSCVVKIRRMN